MIKTNVLSGMPLELTIADLLAGFLGHGSGDGWGGGNAQQSSVRKTGGVYDRGADYTEQKKSKYIIKTGIMDGIATLNCGYGC